MTIQEYLFKLDKVEKIACSSKWNRLFTNPYKYISAQLFKELVYPRNGKEKLVTTCLFFGKEMHIALPASTDIYLTGGKSHDSEIRLARFLIHHLNTGDSFLDIGAHYGYFSLLAGELVGSAGKVRSYEASETTYSILSLNAGNANTRFFHEAVSDNNQPISFYEFPNLYSEYNSSSIEQFEQEHWFKKNPPRKVTVTAKRIDDITSAGFSPDIIKIDVEGAEYRVISGGKHFLTNDNPYVVMEYLDKGRSNAAHQKAARLLKELQYKSYLIKKDGHLELCADVDMYLAEKGLESDNIVFKK